MTATTPTLEEILVLVEDYSRAFGELGGIFNAIRDMRSDSLDLANAGSRIADALSVESQDLVDRLGRALAEGGEE
ncbi:MAG: hypothetical protein AB1899_16915 [Pseudomonadota bacterium]